MSVMWNALREDDSRRRDNLKILAEVGSMGSDLFERYCGSEQEMLTLVNLGLVVISRGKVWLTKTGRNRLMSNL